MNTNTKFKQVAFAAIAMLALGTWELRCYKVFDVTKVISPCGDAT